MTSGSGSVLKELLGSASRALTATLTLEKVACLRTAAPLASTQAWRLVCELPDGCGERDEAH